MALLVLAGCTDDFNESSGIVPSLEPRYLSISKTSFGSSLPYAFNETAFVRSMSTPWKFTSVPSWFSVTPSSGGSDAEIYLAAEENKSADNARTSIFYLESTMPEWKVSKPVTVSQGVAVANASVSVNTLEFPGSGGTESINIEANCRWKAGCTGEWIALTSPSEGSLSVKADENPTSGYRTSTISITTEDGRNTLASIQVAQAPAKVESSATTLTFENYASRYDLDITSEADWTSTASASWIQVSPDNGNKGTTKVSIDVTPNTSVSERTGYVTFSTGTARKLEVKVVQKGIYIETSENSLNLSSVPSEARVTVRSNTEWRVQSVPDWVSVTPVSGKGDTEVTLSVSENLSTSSRTGEIVFGQEGLSLSASVSIIQSGKTLSVDSYNLDFDDKASVRTIEIEGDAAWKAVTQEEWISVSPSEGKGSASISVSVTENTTTSPRAGKVTVSYLDREFVIEVIQEAKYINVDGASFTFPSTGGSNMLNVSTNDSWTIQKEGAATWLSISPESGTGEDEVRITAADNPSVNPRSCMVTLDTRYLQDVMFTITQKARYLTLSAQNILFFARGGTSDPITVETDGIYTVTTDATWLEITRQEGNTFTVTATENSANTARSAILTVALTDLEEGKLSVEIPVLQYTNGSSFIIDGYGEQLDWNATGDSKLSITVKRYTLDKNWDSGMNAGLNVKIEGYTGDKDWNSGGGADNSFDVTKDGYGADKELTGDGSNVNININGYGPDKNQDGVTQ